MTDDEPEDDSPVTGEDLAKDTADNDDEYRDMVDAAVDQVNEELEALYGDTDDDK